MGYMGFGLQKWVHRMNPRKPFQKRTKKAGYETLDINKPKEFRPEVSISSNPSNLNNRIDKIKQRIKLRLRFDKIRSTIYILILLGLGFVIYLAIMNFSESTTYKTT